MGETIDHMCHGKRVCGGKSTPRGERNYTGGKRKGENVGMERSYLTPFLCMIIIKLIF